MTLIYLCYAFAASIFPTYSLWSANSTWTCSLPYKIFSTPTT